MRYSPILLSLLVVASCSKKKSDDTTDTVTEAVSDVAAALTQAYPGSLSISVFPTTTSSSLKLGDTTTTASSDAAPESLKAKEAEAKAYLDGTAEHCLPPSLFRPAKQITETCYEFDQDMISGGRGDRSFGTSNGKSTQTGSNEACLVSFARAQIKSIEEMIDQGLGLQQAMICQAAKDKVDTTAATTPTGIDLADNLKDAADTAVDSRKPKIEVTEAKMSKDEDGVYRVSINVTITKDNVSRTQLYTLAHVPDAEDNSVYHGVMNITRQDPQSQGGQFEGKRYISVAYTRALDSSGVTRLKTELRSARLATALDASAFNSDGTFNYNAGADDNGAYTGIDNPQMAIGAQLFVAFDLNTEDNSGTFEYWQNPGSNYNEAARGMLFSLTKNATTGRLEGCGMSGAALGNPASMNSAMSIRKAIKTGGTLTPTGSYHPFFNTDGGGTCTGSACTKAGSGPNNQTSNWTIPAFSVADNVTAGNVWAKDQVTTYVTRQCVTQDESGAYLIDTAAIPDTAGYSLFNPTNATQFVIAKPERPKNPPAALK